MRIGVDIDGVVSDSYPFWLQELNKHFGKNISVVTNYQMNIDFDVPQEDMNDFFVRNAERLLSMTDVVSGAKEGIETLLREGHELIYVTARSLAEKEVTLRWLTAKGIPYEHVLFTGFTSKVGIVKQLGIEIFIEDYQVNAKLISESGIPVLLLDASYNQEELPADIIRCSDWNEIVQGIRKIQANKT